MKGSKSERLHKKCPGYAISCSNMQWDVVLTLKVHKHK